MTTKPAISEKWIKASILGTLWAASEIVLGSFLHNLKIPFSGNVLTAIALVILISSSYTWTEKGLFWRAGLICALMKTMSPSAVIFGPMIAIVSESLLLEISVRLLGKTFAGYILGSMLAMSWNLFHKIINLVIFYGPNMVELYKSLLKFIEKQFSFHFGNLWLPIFLLLIVYCLLGLVSAIIGMRVGRKMLAMPAENKHNPLPNNAFENKSQPSEAFHYSLTWLAADFLLIVACLLLLNYASLIYWALSITATAVIWALRYRRALRQLSKPRFWIFFAGITMLTAVLFGNVDSATKSFGQGLLIGVEMNFRAILIILGFSVLGTELYNPRIRNFFLKTYFKQLPLALELSFDCLPGMIAHMPDLKTILKNPVTVIYRVVSLAETRLAEIREKPAQKIFILSGAVAEGKTTCLKKIIAILKEKDIKTAGIICPRMVENNLTMGYDIEDIKSGEKKTFLRIEENTDYQKIGKYSIHPQGLALGMQALSTSQHSDNKLVIIDEIGRLELSGKGWAESLEILLKAGNNVVLLAVRDQFVDQVIEKWSFEKPFVFSVSADGCSRLHEAIMNHIGEPV